MLHQSTNAAVNGANSVVSNVASVLEGKLPVNSAWDNIVNVWSSEMKKVEASIEAVKQRSMSIVEDYRYTAECKNPSTYAAKCTEPTGYDTFVSLLTLSANLISNEPLPSNFEQVTDSLMKSEFPIGFLGHSLAAGDFNGDGIYDLASGAWGANVDDGSAPQSGAVYLSYGNADGTLQSPATLRSSFPYKYGHDRFGWSVVALDYNGDGIDDLAVSSPSAQDWEAGLPIPPDPRQAVFLYQGRVEIFFGDEKWLANNFIDGHQHPGSYDKPRPRFESPRCKRRWSQRFMCRESTIFLPDRTEPRGEASGKSKVVRQWKRRLRYQQGIPDGIFLLGRCFH